MVTRNWYNMFKAYRCETTITDGIRNTSGNFIKAGYSVTSSNSSFYFPALLLRPTTVSLSLTNQGIIFGSGSTPATVDDYKLEAMITAGLSWNMSKSITPENDPSWLITLTNTSDEDFTIGEVGILAGAFTAANSGSPSIVLMERSVLENPITIPSGGVGQVEYAIRLQVPEE